MSTVTATCPRDVKEGLRGVRCKSNGPPTHGENKKVKVKRGKERGEEGKEPTERNTPGKTGTAERRRSRNSADKAAVFNLVLPLCIQCGAPEKKQKR